MKLCKDCKHVRRHWPIPWSQAQCEAPQGGMRSPITGEVIMEYKWCSAQRVCDAPKTCGTDGKWWEPK